MGEIQITHQFETRVKHQSQREMQQQGLPPQRSESMDLGRLFCYLGFLYDNYALEAEPAFTTKGDPLAKTLQDGIICHI